MGTISDNKSYGGVQGVCRHASPQNSLGCEEVADENNYDLGQDTLTMATTHPETYRSVSSSRQPAADRL